MDGSRVWVPVDGEPRLGTVSDHTYAPKTGAPLLSVELETPVGGTETVVVSPWTDDIVFETPD